MSRTTRNKSYLPDWVTRDWVRHELDNGCYFYGPVRLEGEERKNAIREWRADWYKPGRKNYRPRILRHQEERKFRNKNKRELRGNLELVDSRTKSKLPYWD